jgi:hypothetical protein
MSDFRGLLATLVRSDVEFIIVGGVAATIHGSSRLTVDVAVVYGRSAENRRRLVSALAAESPYLRDAPAGLPFRWEESTLARGLNFTLTTRLGEIDLLGEIPGGGTYEDLLAHTIEVAPFGIRCRCLDLEALIRSKRAAGRPKDLEAIAELEWILEERGRA